MGVDLGTTNSLAALWRDGAATIIPNAQGENLTASCVSIDGSGDILVGGAGAGSTVDASRPKHGTLQELHGD